MGRKRKNKIDDKSRETLKRIIENNKYRQGRSREQWENNEKVLDYLFIGAVVICLIAFAFFVIF